MILRHPAMELLAYGAASAAALALDVGLLSALVGWAGWPYLPAATTSFLAGAVLLYCLSISFVFRIRKYSNPVLELPVFIALGLVGLLVNTTVMFISVEWAHVHYLAGKAAAAGCTFTTNFLLRRNVMFSRAAHTQ